MISKTAKADIEDMWEAGLKPTFDDIIRLNALALAVERTRSGFALSHLPRVAFLGEVAFREPTIGADIWLDEASQLFAADKAETFMLLRAFSLSMPQDKLPDPYDEKAVLKGVAEMRDRLAFATLRQMSAAIGYAVHGFEHDSCEEPVASAESHSDDGPTQSVQSSYDIGLLREGMALRIGSAAEIRALPRREMQEMILRVIQSQTVQNVRKNPVSLAEDNYLRTLDAITERLESEKPAEGVKTENQDASDDDRRQKNDVSKSDVA